MKTRSPNCLVEAVEHSTSQHDLIKNLFVIYNEPEDVKELAAAIIGVLSYSLQMGALALQHETVVKWLEELDLAGPDELDDIARAMIQEYELIKTGDPHYTLDKLNQFG